MQRWITAILIVPALALAGAACGGKKDTPTPDPAKVDPSAEPAAKADPTPDTPPKADDKAPAATKADDKAPAAPAKAEVGKTAPDFQLTDTAGEPFQLSQMKGKTVVLEWFNPDCPFVKYAYDKGPLAGMAANQSGEELVWVQINSGAPGKQGTGNERNDKAKADWGLPHAVLIDAKGQVGRTYLARNTPQMVIVDAEGVIRYMGALDNAPLGNVAGDGELVNYVQQALEEMAAGKPVSVPETKPYGCSVKYGET